MAHFILEYSTNLDHEKLDPRGLLKALISTAVATGVFPQAGCRGRTHPCNEYFVADGTATFGFVHLQVRMGAGRTDEQKDHVVQVLTDVLKVHLTDLYATQGLAISVELVELPTHKANINNLRDYLEES